MQSKTGSAVETVIGTAIGFVISFLLNMVVLPFFGMHPKAHQLFWITTIFTVASLARGYYVRRLFNWFHVTGWLETKITRVKTLMVEWRSRLGTGRAGR